MHKLANNNSHLETIESGLNDSGGQQSAINMGSVGQKKGFEYLQGAQGSQMKIESNMGPFDAHKDDMEISPEDLGYPRGMHGGDLNAFDPNTTQTNALLNIRDNRINLCL